jgi:hypothetical protein
MSVEDVNYWVARAKECLTNAKEISDRTGKSFKIVDPILGIDATYSPNKTKYTKAEAIAIIEQGVTLTDATRAMVVEALQSNDDDEDWDSSWTSSSF